MAKPSDSKPETLGSNPSTCAMVPSSSGLRQPVVCGKIEGSNPFGTVLYFIYAKNSSFTNKRKN
jgi:hypothetical protein